MNGSNAQHNPMRGENTKVKKLYPLDFKLCLLGGHTENEQQIEVLFEMKALCEEHKIPLKTRDFDPTKEEDANLVKSLPAIYLLGKWNEVSDVLYPDEKCIERIKTELLRCKEKFEAKQKIKNDKETFLARISKSFWPKKKISSSTT